MVKTGTLNPYGIFLVRKAWETQRRMRMNGYAKATENPVVEAPLQMMYVSSCSVRRIKG